MGRLFQDIDGLLRGRFTQREDLLEGRIAIPIGTLVRAGLLLGALYGVFMGLFAVLRAGGPPTSDGWMQLLATTVKVPLLFLLTLLVTFPSLYVFSALANSRLRHSDTLRLLLAAISVNLALLASFGPVTGFFTLSTDSYPFMVFLNVIFFAVSGLVGVGFLRKAVGSVFSPAAESDPEPLTPLETAQPPAPLPASAPLGQGSGSGEGDDEEDGQQGKARRAVSIEAPSTKGLRPFPVRPAAPARPEARRPGSGQSIFRVWIFIYAIVGSQMGWILRPFVGTPGQPFELFRERDSHFFSALIDTLHRLLF